MAEIKTITVSGVEEKPTKVGMKTVIKDQDGKKYNFFNEYQGTPTAQAVAFRQLGVAVGKTIVVEFVNKPFTTPDGKTGFTKEVKALHSSSGATQAPGPTPAKTDDVVFGQVFTHVVNGRLAAGIAPVEIIEELPVLRNLVSAMLKSPTPFADTLVPPSRTEEDDEIRVEDIPFS